MATSDNNSIRPRISYYDAEILVGVLNSIHSIPEIKGYLSSDELVTTEKLRTKLHELVAVAKARDVVRGLTENSEQAYQRVLADLRAKGFDPLAEAKDSSSQST